MNNMSEVEKLKIEISILERQLKESHKREHLLSGEILQMKQKQFRYFNEEECWIWDSDDVESNYIESLICPVVICPRILEGYLGGE